VLPKPADLGALLIDALGASADFARPYNVAGLERKGG
jgi:hypothetical protein